jgi:hypothetical protein
MRLPRHIIEARSKRVRALYAQGASIGYIAFVEGVSKSTVKRDLRPLYRERDRLYAADRYQNGKPDVELRQCEWCKATFTGQRHQRCCSDVCAGFRFEWRRFYPDQSPTGHNTRPAP